MPEGGIGISVPRWWEPWQALEQLSDVASTEHQHISEARENVSASQVAGDSPNLKSHPPPHHVPQVVAGGLARVVVFEDDVRFESNFRGRLERLMEEVEAERLPWDLM